MHEDPNSKAMNIVNSYTFSYGPENSTNIESQRMNTTNNESQRLNTNSSALQPPMSKFYFSNSQREMDAVKEEYIHPATANANAKRPTINIEYAESDSNSRTIETFKSNNTSMLEGKFSERTNLFTMLDSEIFASSKDYREAYEELESHTNMLYKMTVQTPDPAPTELNLKKKKGRPRINTDSVNNEFNLQQKAMINDDLASILSVTG